MTFYADYYKLYMFIRKRKMYTSTEQVWNMAFLCLMLHNFIV